ncbi:Calcium-dependent protein kinase 24 [Hibiscus syriacus]|uniref:non-specific serine/threonine protein kinase n=1 Tax=Hibiscus syriacus TaxID=106335 RepID=A0A6A3BR36_HIBSY|nr:calcium-dependent protein kinase 24-like [Hibiscus syriacus]KAE8718351.1 Calcium-dependent protein kinase 24 [Hibiscus syriacus]
MGSCISAQSKLQGSILKKYYYRNSSKEKSNRARFDRSESCKSVSRWGSNSRVLKNPSGDNIFDRYTIGKELGRGEFGITHQCFDLETGEAFACKKISKAKLRTEVDLEDVRREVEIMRHLPKHPNIVAFREVFEDNEAVYLVMELCHGGELFDRIVAKGHYSERAAASVTKTILEIVKVCHEHGVIHRDLKPENFLFADETETAPIKAIDFGLSIFYESGERFSDIVGSPYYMAPEVLRRNYGEEVDIWSIGVILYILLCGVPPFWAETEEGIAHAIIKGEIDFQRDPWPRVSSEAKELVKCMLHPNPYDRLTLQEVLEHPWIQNIKHCPNVNLGENVRSRIKQFSLMSKFKKKVLRVVADNLPEDQIDSTIEMFNMMDTDDDGHLSFEELRDGLEKLGHSVEDPDVKMLMESADVDGSGTLTYDEFVTMAVHLRRIGDDQLSQAFRYFDKNQTGYIEFDELKEALLQDDNSPNNEQLIKDIMLDVDKDKDDRISYQEFKAMMFTGMDWKMASRQYSRALLNAVSIKILKKSGQLK